MSKTAPTNADGSAKGHTPTYYIPNYDRQADVMHVIAIATLLQAIVFLGIYMLDDKVSLLPTDPILLLGATQCIMGFAFLGITWVLRHVKDCPCNANGGKCFFAKEMPAKKEQQANDLPSELQELAEKVAKDVNDTAANTKMSSGMSTAPTNADGSAKGPTLSYYIPNYDRQAGVMHVIAIATLLQAVVFLGIYMLDGKFNLLPTDPILLLGATHCIMGVTFLGITWVLRHVKDCPCNANGGKCFFAKEMPAKKEQQPNDLPSNLQELAEKVAKDGNDAAANTKMSSAPTNAGGSAKGPMPTYYIPNYERQAGVMHVIAIATLLQAVVFLGIYMLNGKFNLLPTDPILLLGATQCIMGVTFLGITWVLRHVKDCPCNANGGKCFFAKEMPAKKELQPNDLPSELQELEKVAKDGNDTDGNTKMSSGTSTATHRKCGSLDDTWEVPDTDDTTKLSGENTDTKKDK